MTCSPKEVFVKILLPLLLFNQFVFCMVFHEYFLEDFGTDPVNTEFLAYKALKKHPLEVNVDYVVIPWAYLINTSSLHKVSKIKVNSGFTICQHINYEVIIPFLREMGITTLFIPHAIKDKNYSGVTVLPFPHSAVNGVGPAQTKDIYYSFVGVSWTHPVRAQILALPQRPDCVIKERRDWHFYQSSAEQEIEKQEYQEILARSRFSLCPRGTGASTLRFWESLQAGAIPVLLSDQMTLPEEIDWDACIVRIPEEDVSKIDCILSEISLEQEQAMRAKCLEIFPLCSGDNIVNTIRVHYQSKSITLPDSCCPARYPNLPKRLQRRAGG